MKFNIIVGMIIFAIVFFIILYKLPMDQNTKIVSAISAISSILIFVTVIQAYQSYQQTAQITTINFNTQSWQDILINSHDQTYLDWYGGDLGGLELYQHKDWSRIATNLEAINDLHKFSENGFNFKGIEGWRHMSWYWINDKIFNKYWENDKESFNHSMHEYVKYFQNLTKEENDKLSEKERNSE